MAQRFHVFGQNSASGDPRRPGGRRPLPLLAFLMVLGLLLAGCAQPEEGGETGAEGEEDGASEDETADADSELTELRIAYVPATTTLLVHVAEDQGYFEDNGLQVELTEASNISEMIPALGRQLEISLGTTTDLIRAADTGLGTVQILGNTISTEDNPFAQLITTPDSGIEQITDLEGKRVASPTLSGVIHMAVLYWAQQEGLDPESIEGVQVPPPNHPDQLNAGQVDAVEALEPFAGQLLAADNVSLGNPFAAIKLPLATNFWVADREWAQDNPDAVEGFRLALEDAQEFLEEDEEEGRRVLEEYTGMPSEVAQQVPLPTYDLEVREDDLATWIDVLQELGEFEGDLDPESLVLTPGS